jgi:hypothetical protein
MSTSFDTTPAPFSPSMRERLIDRLTVALPLLQRSTVTAAQTCNDTATALTALTEMVAILRESVPAFDHPADRTVGALSLALTRAGLTMAEAAHLSGMPAARLGALVLGGVITGEERVRLSRVLPEWRPAPQEGGQSR